jgi:hypothetical protein
MKRKIKYQPKLIKCSFSINQDQKTIEINGETYYPVGNAAWQSGTREGWETHNREKKKIFDTGKRNLWAWTRGEDYGYKIFTQGKYNKRRIEKYLWHRSYDIFLRHNIGKSLVYAVHKLQNILNNYKNTKITPESKAIVEFNGGDFYGLKIEKINEGDKPEKDERINFREQIKCAFLELGHVPWRGRSFIWADFAAGGNVLRCSKTGELVLVDIDFLHVRNFSPPTWTHICRTFALKS